MKTTDFIIRKENKEDYYKTEHMVMRAFWNQSRPGCNEHLLVHKVRASEDYLPELSLVAELDGEIVGAIFACRAWVAEGTGEKHEVLTFGPLAVEPTHLFEGIGKALLKEFLRLGKEAGYSGVVICGEPGYYPKHGFKTCDKFGIVHSAFGNSDAFMAYPLNDSFAEVHGTLVEPGVFEECESEDEIREFTKNFPYYKPLKLSCWLHVEKCGRIAQIRKNSFTISFFGKDIPAKLKGSFYEMEASEFPVVGDYVTFLYNPLGDSTILSVVERTSFLHRPDQAKTGVMQYMVANVDYTFIVTSLNEDYSFNRIARYASIALQGGSVPVVILTKSDLCNNVGRFVREVETISENVRVHAVSAILGIGLDELGRYFEPGKTICLMGSSGAGKSTLINTLMGKEILKTSEVREHDSTGKHTTTSRRIVELPNGATLIDTPGMREVGMAETEEGINDTFSDIVELAGRCRFSNCRHDTEPGCAIKAALSSGELSRERWDLYNDLSRENHYNYAKKKAIAKWNKERLKNKVIY